MTIIDTNVASEMINPQRNASVVAWVNQQPEGSLYTTSITEAELLYGLQLMPQGRRRTGLQEAIMAILHEDFARRILAFDSVAARICAEIMAVRRRAGRPIEWADAQIAAIAQAHKFAVATRNVSDFEGCGIELINPWD
jgi:predicted nucleic acid-binding protein